MYKYKKVGLGGTFDHFHKGHQAFLLFASQLAEHLVIGVTTPEMIQHKKNATQIEPYETRAEAVQAFTKNFFNKVDVFPLTDPYGPTLHGSNVQAIAATVATQKGAEAVNRKRKELGLSELPIHVCDLEHDENGNPLASEKIRAGKINRQGKVYLNTFSEDISLSEEQKTYFVEPQGDIISHPSPSELSYVVGDTSLETFIKYQWPYQLGVVDFLKERKAYQPPVINVEKALTVTNPPGVITRALVETLQKALEMNDKHIIVEGEEDLAAVALVLLAPLGAHIYYGQPGKGIIDMIVTEDEKEYCYKALNQR